MGIPASVLTRPRLALFAGVGACVLTWFLVASHTGRVSVWPAVVIVAFLVMPATLLLVWIALPLWSTRLLFVLTAACVALAIVCGLLDWGLAGNFAKLGAAVFAGWAFLVLFEQLSWVVIVALVVPLVDIISVWRGPTHTITQHHFEVYTAVAIAFLVPGGGAAYLGPPDVLFYALFLAAAARWNLRVGWTWASMTFMYAMTVIIATATHVGGLPALPFLSFGFVVPNADLLWRAMRSAGSQAPSS